MTIGRRVVGTLCIVVAAAGCSGSDKSAPTPTTYHRRTKLSLQQVLGTKTKKGACPAGSVADVSQPTCYDLAPAFVTQDDVQTASAIFDDGVGKWGVTARVASSARRRYLDQMTGTLVNKEIAMVIDGRVVNVAQVHTGITGSDFEITSHEKWTKSEVTKIAAGIAPATNG